MSQSCEIQTINGQSCVVCAEQPFIAPTPGQVLYDQRTGWNAAARSVVVRVGDCYVEFTAPLVAGVVCGLANRYDDTSPANVKHGFYVYESAGAPRWAVWEGSQVVGTGAVRNLDTDLYRVERRGARAFYYVAGQLVYKSAAAIAGEVFVLACLYSAPDTVN